MITTKQIRSRLTYEMRKLGPIEKPVIEVERDPDHPNHLVVYAEPGLLEQLRIFAKLARQTLARDRARSRRKKRPRPERPKTRPKSK